MIEFETEQGTKVCIREDTIIEFYPCKKRNGKDVEWCHVTTSKSWMDGDTGESENETYIFKIKYETMKKVFNNVFTINDLEKDNNND